MKAQQKLTAQEVVIAARTALQNHTLGGEFYTDCCYKYTDGTHCSVGAALDEDTIKLINDKDSNDSYVAALCDRKILLIENDTDYVVISNIQLAHDRTAGSHSGDDFCEPMAWFLDGAEEYLRSEGRWAR